MAEVTFDKRKSKEKKVKLKKKRADVKTDQGEIDDNIPSVASLNGILEDNEACKLKHQKEIGEISDLKMNNSINQSETNHAECIESAEVKQETLTVTDAEKTIEKLESKDCHKDKEDTSETRNLSAINKQGDLKPDNSENVTIDTTDIEQTGVTDSASSVVNEDVKVDNTSNVTDIYYSATDVVQVNMSIPVSNSSSLGDSYLPTSESKYETCEEDLTVLQNSPKNQNENTRNIEEETVIEGTTVDSAQSRTSLSAEDKADTKYDDDSKGIGIKDERLYPDLSQQTADYKQQIQHGQPQIDISKSRESHQPQESQEQLQGPQETHSPLKPNDLQSSQESEESQDLPNQQGLQPPNEPQELIKPQESQEQLQGPQETHSPLKPNDLQSPQESEESQDLPNQQGLQPPNESEELIKPQETQDQLQGLQQSGQPQHPRVSSVISSAPQLSQFIEPNISTNVVEQLGPKEVIQTLTLDQLNSLYYNPQLQMNESFIDGFVQYEMRPESHEFYEILLNYQRARKNLMQCEQALKILVKQYENLLTDIWVTDPHTETVKGTCGDKSNCSATHSYEQARMNETAVEELRSVLEKMEKIIQEELSLYSYSAQLSKLQVESYIHFLFVSTPVLRGLPRNLPVNACDHLSSDETHQLDKLKTCISILFTFHRLPIEDEKLVRNLQQWTERLISSCLRVCTFWDHLFVLNHIMRCPAGIGSWASAFIQIPAIPSNEDTVPLTFGNHCLDHAVTALATVLIPTRNRADFLCHMQKMLTPGPDQKTVTWVMVDSDGEEDEDPQNAWMFLHENDVVAILKQVPLADIFRHIFFIFPSQFNDDYEYDIKNTTEAAMYRVFAFSTRIVYVLGIGLQTYNMPRYRQLNKRLGRMIRQCVQYVSDHWKNFKACYKGDLAPENLQKLQTEFDAFFLRAVNHIHIAQRFGSCQFIADMPFEEISMDTMWKLLWLLHQDHGQSVEVSAIPTAAKCMEFVKDESSYLQLCDTLQSLAVPDGVYLLNTMTNMTESCQCANSDFVETITKTVFEVSYVCSETRDVWSKMGRELLSAVVANHSYILSYLTPLVQANMNKLGAMGLYLYTSLPLESWLPADHDIVIVRQWLLNSGLGTPKNQLAQLILSRINWGYTHDGSRLVVPWRFHKQVSVLVVEAYQKYIIDKNLGSIIIEGVKLISAAVQQYTTSEQEFNTWCMDLLLKLALHRRSLPKDDLRLMDMQGPAPDIKCDHSLRPLVKGTEERNPPACFVALILSKYGHNSMEFLSDGITLLETLASMGLYKPIICAMYYTTPMFYSTPKYLLESLRFKEVLLSVLKADDSYFKLVKGLLTYVFPGPITKLFISMIQSQIHDAKTSECQDVTPVLEFWIKLILNIQKWPLDRNCCCVLESILEATFTCPSAIEPVISIFLHSFKLLRQHEKNQSMMSVLVSWVTSSTTLPTFLDKASCPEFSWLAYVILTVEGKYEQTSDIWPTIHSELHTNPNLTVDQALKKSTMKLKVEQAPVSSKLCIYRWAQQALDMPIDHPAAELIWQRFFILYLGRYLKSTSLPTRASVGEKFFTGNGYESMLKKMKKKLAKIANHYDALSKDPAAVEGSPDSGPSGDRHQMFCKMVQLYQTFQLWLEETRLHDNSLYLPDLPSQYQPDRLLLIFQNDSTPWLEFLDVHRITETLASKVKDWRNTGTPDQNPKAGTPKVKPDQRPASERILSRLNRCDKPLPPPPVEPVKAPVPEISSTIIEDKGALLHLLESDLNVLKSFASQFCSKMNRQITHDHNFLKLIPNLYRNVPKEVTVSLKCTSMINPLHKCTKPGSAVIKIQEQWNDPIVQSDINENRADFKQLLLENTQGPSQTVVICAVHTENAITMLVKLARSCTDERRKRALCDVACSLFFRLCSTVTDSIQRLPPTQQFFSACMDILGKEFIQHEPNSVDYLLHTAIERPELAGLISPHFIPLLAPAKFVQLYTTLQETLSDQTLELSFMLLTKFDVHKWLSEYNPSGREVTVFVEKMGKALTVCGPEPDDSYWLVFGQYLGHEKILLRHKFPLYLHQVVAAILQGSSIGKISGECWEVLQNHCFYNSQSEDERPCLTAQYPEVFTNLSIDEIQNLLQWLGHEFLQIREKGKDFITFGLYPKWKRYVQHVANFLRDLSKCLIDKMTPILADSTATDGLDRLLRQIVDAFAPWLQPMYINKLPSMPWTASDAESAQNMVKAFIDVVRFAHYRTEDLRQMFYHNVLSLLWNYYATVLSKPPVTSDVIAIFNMEIALLPWQQFVPNLQVMQTMADMKDNGCPMGFNLVSDIAAEIPWNDVVTWYETYQTLEVRSKFEGALFLILIQAFGEHKYVENPEMEKILHHAAGYTWEDMYPDAYRKACSYFLCGSDPKCLLVERTAPETVGLRLLKSASGFTVEISQRWTPDWSIRRLSFLHSYTSLICQCTYVTDWDQSHLSTIIINLLTEIETIQSSVLDAYTRDEESSDMAKEVLGLLNNCKPDGEGTSIVMTGIIQWLQESPQTILLSPVIHAATRHLASMTYMCHIVEQCIELAFVPARGKSAANPWDVVLTAMVVPELSLSEFISTCFQESSFLLLYAYILQREPLCESLTEKQGLIEMIFDWTDKAKPGPENECKLLLWWHKVLQLIMEQIRFGRDKATCVHLLKKFMHKLQSYGEDRVSGGLLGAIGLGKRSVLSEKFRVCSRAIVAFISCQVISETELRFQTSDPATASSSAKQDLSSLLSLRSNKKYLSIKPEIDDVCDFVKDLTKCFTHVFDLMSKLRISLYPDVKYLSVLDKS